MAEEEMKAQGLLIVISAPSGGGKTTICERLLRKDPRLVRSISATTREPRGRERAGRDYIFLKESVFTRLAARGEFLEWAQVHGHCYGTPARAVRRHQAQGRDVMLTIDVQGGLNVKRQDPQAVLIFVKPPSLQELQRRLQGRGTDSRATIARRLRNARWEMSQAGAYDYNVVNNTLPEAVRQIGAIIAAERLRTQQGKTNLAGHKKAGIGNTRRKHA
jgi:guanylate kinase